MSQEFFLSANLCTKLSGSNITLSVTLNRSLSSRSHCRWSNSGKKNLISAAAVASLSEPCEVFRVSVRPKEPRIEPGSSCRVRITYPDRSFQFGGPYVGRQQD